MKKKIRIMHITQAVGGGVERYLQMLLKYVNREQYENILICSNACDAGTYYKLADMVERVEMKRSIGFHDLSAICEIRRLLHKYQPDVVYAHSSKAGALARVASIGLRCKCIYNPHGWAFNMRGSSKKQAVYAMIEKLLAPLCDKIICISDAEKRSALNRKICEEEKLQVILNGIDIEAYQNNSSNMAKQKNLTIPEDAFVVGMVGRISPQKAPDIFVKMANIINDEIPGSHFIVVGNGEQEEEIKKYAKDHGFADRLHITGWVDDPMSYVELFDAACLLSRWEGFGLVLAEYMLARKPIVATAVDAIPDIINHGENGLLVKVDDYKAAAEAVLKLYQDRALVDHLTANGFLCVHEKYSVKRVVEETEELFKSLITAE